MNGLAGRQPAKPPWREVRHGLLGLALSSLVSGLSSLGTAGAARAARVGRQQTLALSGDGLVQRPCWVASVCRRLAAPPGVPLASWDTWALRALLGRTWGLAGAGLGHGAERGAVGVGTEA